MKEDLERVREYLQKWFPEFGYRSPRDDLFLASLEDDFPHADLVEQIKTFHAWCLDRAGGKPMNYRLTLRKWVSNTRPNRGL